MSKSTLPRQSEAAFTAQVLQLAALYRWRCYHARAGRTARGWRTPVQGKGAAGFPDLVLCRGEMVLFVELKSDQGRTTPEQDRWLQGLRAAGQQAAVWRPRDFAAIQHILTDG